MRLRALLDLTRAACDVPGVGVDLTDDPDAGYVGAVDLWKRDEVEIWDRAGRRRGRLVAYDLPERVGEPLAPRAHGRLRHAAGAVGDLLSVEQLLETELELSSAVSMTQSAVERRSAREARVRDEVESTLRARVERLEVALEDARTGGRGKHDLSGGQERSGALARAALEAREMRGLLDDVATVRQGSSRPDPVVHRVEDLVADALALVVDPRDASHGSDPVRRDVQVVSNRDATVLVAGAEVTRALRHLLEAALTSGREHERADRVEVDVEVRSDVCLVSVEDDGSPGRARQLRELLAGGPGGSADPADTGAEMSMAYVRAVVEAHAGRVWVEDGELGGAKVCLTLPAAPVGELARRRHGAEGHGRHRPVEAPGGAVTPEGPDGPDLPGGPGGSRSTTDGTGDEPGEAVEDDAVPDNVRGLFDRR